MTHKEKARELFVKGYNCCQAVFAAFCDVTGIEEDAALKLSAPFGAGMGKMREVCGACSGMFMVAGALFGYTEADDDKKGEHYALIQEMAEKFKEKNGGTIICRELLKHLSTNTIPVPEARTEEYYKKRPCLKFVEDAADILDEYINR